MAAETSLFTLNAQVYALDKNQKWTPLTQEIVPVTFLHSELTGNTRILAMDGGVTVVNSTIMPNMQYRRPAETFVQWFDSQHILYGLNLTSAADGDGVCAFQDTRFMFILALHTYLVCQRIRSRHRKADPKSKRERGQEVREQYSASFRDDAIS